MTDPVILLVLSLVLPLVAGAGVVVFGRWPNGRDTSTIVVACVLLIVTVMLASHVSTGGRPRVDVGQWLPGFWIAFEVEPLGMLFGLVASSLWILTTFYAIGYMRGHHEIHQTRFFFCFPIAIFAALSAAYAANLFTLFIAYELMTISTYPLVTHAGTDDAKRGGRVYLGILISTSISMFLLAIAWVNSVAGTLDFRAGGILREPYESGAVSTTALGVMLGLFVFGIAKGAIMPFHRWLPAAMVAPTPVSALLHAVAVVKVGVFSILKISVGIFGIGLLRDTGVSLWIAYVAGYTLVVASLVAMTKDNLKARLAYSTIAQLAYITLGAMLATPESVIGGGLHIAMHAVSKITLFFCAGAIYVAAHKKNISDLDGLGRRMPFTFLAFLIASLGIIGLPPGGGVWSKWFLAVGTVQRDQYLLAAALMISSLLNIAYLVPIPLRAFLYPPKDDHDQHHHGDGHSTSSGEATGITEAPLFCVVPLCMTAVGSVILFFMASWMYELLLPITQ